MKPTILSNNLYVPTELVEDQQLEHWHYSWKDIVFEYVLDDVGNAKLNEFGEPEKVKKEVVGVLSTYKEIVSSDGTSYISLPRGDLGKLNIFLQNGYVDHRPIAPLGFRLEINPATMQDKRWPDQLRCAQEYLKHGYGIIEGDTGSGKTVIGAAVMSKLRFTTLIVSTMTGGLAQWVSELRLHTNITQLEEQHGIKLIGEYSSRIKEPFPIMVATVQALLQQSGKEFLTKYRSYYGLVLVDEVHTVASPEYSKVIRFMNPFSFLGLTATVERRDKRHYLLYDMVGPVVAKGVAHQMPPTVYFVSTGEAAPPNLYKTNLPPEIQWNIVLNHLAESETRYEIIKKFVYHDIDDGRKIACIAERRVFARTVYEQLVQDGYKTVYVDGETSTRLRDKIYQEFREGKYQAICAGKVLNALINLPNLDCIHLLTPSKAKGTSKQIYGRARREVAGKRNPIVRYYVDKGGQLDGCYKNQQRLCAENGWAVEHIGTDAAKMTGLSVWRKRVPR